MSVTSWLALLTALFLARVVGQVIAGLVAPDWLPDFDAFDSGLLPYPVLLCAQVVILVVQVRVIRAHHAGTVRARTSRGRILFACGIAYGLVMLARALVTIAVYGREWWWHGAIPIAFHWVLAGFVMVLARFHLNPRCTTLRAPA